MLRQASTSFSRGCLHIVIPRVAFLPQDTPLPLGSSLPVLDPINDLHRSSQHQLWNVRL
jgi:hypothetical protein